MRTQAWPALQREGTCPSWKLGEKDWKMGTQTQTEAEGGVGDTPEWHPHSAEWMQNHLLKDSRELTE